MDRRRLLVLSLGGLGAALILVMLIGAILQLSHAGQVLPRVSAAHIDLGGRSPEDARAAVRAAARDLETSPVTVRYDDLSFQLDPEIIGFRVDVAATIDQALTAGRHRGTLGNLISHIDSLWRERDSALVTSYDQTALDDWIGTIAGSLDRTPFPGAIEIEPATFEVSALPPVQGREVEQPLLREAVVRALTQPGAVELPAPVNVIPIQVQPDDVESVAEQARRALAEPIILTHDLGDLTVERDDLAALLALREVQTDTGSTAELMVPADAVEAVFAARTGSYEVNPVSAQFDVDRTPPETLDEKSSTTWQKVPIDIPIVESRQGWTFDIERIAGQLSELVGAGAREAELDLRVLEPEFSTQDARAARMTHLLSTFTTHHACCQNRVANIQRLADMVDGTLVMPDEQFSINQISGDRSCTKGFLKAGMILRGELVDACGGGVSQFGTTTFNAAYFAGVQLDEWKAHSFYISRYPMGREATINYPSPDIDVHWTNTTGFPILVKTSYTPTSITVSFYGHSDVKEVRAIHGQPTNYRNWTTQYRENKSLPPGTQRRVQTGQRGFSVVVTREVVREDGSVDRREIRTVYLPATEIIQRNSDPAPKPSPTPSPPPPPSPDPEPTPAT